jgi:hypothetical protein
MTASVSSQLNKLIQMQEASSIAEAAHVKELQKDLNIEMNKRVNAESQLEAVQQDYTITTEELVNQLEAAKKDYISATEELDNSHIELNESQNRHAEMEQQVILLEQEAKSELNTAEETVTRLEAQLEVEFDKLTAIEKVLAKSQRQSEDEVNANIEAQAQLKKDYKNRESALHRELELLTEERVRDIQPKYKNLTTSQRNLA